MKNIELAGPSITKSDEKYVLDAFRNGWYGKNKYYYVETFEKVFSKYHNRKFALMTSNCTSAIHLLLLGLGIKKNDEVIAPDSTWIGSVAAINYVGAKPIFVDVDKNNWCICPKAVSNSITKRTKAVIAVNLYGNMADYDKLVKICKRNNIFLIEDAAESLGSKYKMIKSGKFGIGSVFSFHRTKTIATGEGGILLTDNKSLFEKCKLLRDHGRSPNSYDIKKVAYKYMPFNMQASLGYSQFLRLRQIINKKRDILNKYKKQLKEFSLQFNINNTDIYNGVWAVTIIIDSKYKITSKNLINELAKNKIASRGFFKPLSSQPAYKKFKSKFINKNAKYLAKFGVTLPSSLNLKDEEIIYISNIIGKFIRNNYDI